MPQIHQRAETIADAIIREVGKSIVLGLPLGLGKAPHIANALFARAAADPSVRLNIFTALTLEKPHFGNEIERRFLEPITNRLLGGYPEFAYVKALRSGNLPPNIEINEFFFLAGRWLGVPHAQQSYISANYTHAARYLLERGVNVLAQLVAKRGSGEDARYSLSCNTDITLDILPERKAGRAKFMLVGQVNSELPFMPGAGDLPSSEFAHILDSPSTDFPLFAPPNEPLGLTEYATGLHIARLVPDGGTLQIGIGQEGDAAVAAMILRHKENAAFREAVTQLSPGVDRARFELAPFDKGLHGVSEMLVSSFLALIDAGILKREVDGALISGGFFVGPKEFYRRLREMPPELLAKIQMREISFTNQIYGGEEVKRVARIGARFVNSAMMATLLGAVVSDGLEDGRVVSGVGGQFNFVQQAFALADARSILSVKAARGGGKKATSNIRWRYGHETVPRHMRDIIVSEYGVADLRGRTDAEVIAAMLSIADSRFQAELLRQAKDAGKIAKAWEIPAAYRDNTPERLARVLTPFRERGFLPAFPLGCDFDETERRLFPALEQLNAAAASPRALFALAWTGSRSAPSLPGISQALARLQLDKPKTLRDRIYRLLVKGALDGSRMTDN